jgi:hypothetical protein
VSSTAYFYSCSEGSILLGFGLRSRRSGRVLPVAYTYVYNVLAIYKGYFLSTWKFSWMVLLLNVFDACFSSPAGTWNRLSSIT